LTIRLVGSKDLLLKELGLLLVCLDGNDKVGLGALDPLTLVGTLGKVSGTMGAAFWRTTVGEGDGTRASL
jgi:hypothetical protein